MAIVTDQPESSAKTVVVLGASYGGARAARLLALSLPAGWRLVVIDRNSHMNREFAHLLRLAGPDPCRHFKVTESKD